MMDNGFDLMGLPIEQTVELAEPEQPIELQSDEELRELATEARQVYRKAMNELQRRADAQRARQHDHAWRPEVEKLAWHQAYREQRYREQVEQEKADRLAWEAEHIQPESPVETIRRVHQETKTVFGV